MTGAERRQQAYEIRVGARVRGLDIERKERKGTVTWASNHHLVLDGRYTVPRERASIV
jgi:hypothetical protein